MGPHADDDIAVTVHAADRGESPPRDADSAGGEPIANRLRGAPGWASEETFCQRQGLLKVRTPPLVSNTTTLPSEEMPVGLLLARPSKLALLLPGVEISTIPPAWVQRKTS